MKEVDNDFFYRKPVFLEQNRGVLIKFELLQKGKKLLSLGEKVKKKHTNILTTVFQTKKFTLKMGKSQDLSANHSLTPEKHQNSSKTFSEWRGKHTGK